MKSKEIQLKVDRIKTKMNATGDKGVPVESRFPLKIEFHGEGNQKFPLRVYFDKNDVGGRILDSAVRQGGIEHLHDPFKNGFRLKLTHVDLSETVHELSLSKPLRDNSYLSPGDSLIIAIEDQST